MDKFNPKCYTNGLSLTLYATVIIPEVGQVSAAILPRKGEMRRPRRKNMGKTWTSLTLMNTV
jgi:hypothetical protein